MTNRTGHSVSAGRVAVRRARAAALQPVAIVIGALLAGVASGQENGAVTVDVTECVKLTSPAERLACFEAGVSDVMRDRAPATPAAPAPPAQREAASSREPTATPAPRPAAAPRATPAVPQPSVRAEPAPEARRAEPAPARSAEAAAPARSSRRDEASRPASDDIVGVIQDLRQTVPNSYIITLADGQVWRQTRAAPYPLTTGATVRIYKVERWGGSYRLTAVGRNGFIQVEPIR